MSVYPLIIKQLIDDGHAEAAAAVARASHAEADTTSKVKLTDIYCQYAVDEAAARDAAAQRADALSSTAAASTFPKYVPTFVTPHQDVCRVARYSADGQLVATGAHLGIQYTNCLPMSLVISSSLSPTTAAPHPSSHQAAATAPSSSSTSAW